MRDAAGDPFERVPELSRRARGSRCGRCSARSAARGWPGSSRGWPANAAALAEGIRAIEGAEVVHDVVFTQVCVRFGDDDDLTREVVRLMLEDGTAWTTGSTWQGTGGAAALGQQLVDQRRRRGRDRGGSAPGGGRGSRLSPAR